MKKYFLILFAALLLGSVKAAPGIRWMQQPAVSPDGQWVAFEFKGNICRVPVAGGQAQMLTSNSSYNGYPVWSHDGRYLAFASDRYGNFDVFVMPSGGGPARRLTSHSSRDIPSDFSPDNSQVYFSSARHDVSTSVRFPNDNLWLKLYSVPVSGGQSRFISGAGMEFAHVDRSGKHFIYQDRKGTESALRKHHISPVTRDIWQYDQVSDSYLRLSLSEGEDREPVWGDNGNFYYLSEREGNQNIYRSSIAAPGKVNRLTDFSRDPVRNLSRSASGVLVFTQNGDLYTLQEGGKPRKLDIHFAADLADDMDRNVITEDIITELAVSPGGKEIAFIRHGEVFVSATDGTRARNISNTPYEEKMISFSPDGKKLICSSEINGSWQICEAIMPDPEDNIFYLAGDVLFRPVIATPADEFQGLYSPDGKQIAYWENRNTLKTYDLTTRKSQVLWDGTNNYSYQDGDHRFSWSPDSRYVLMASQEGFSGQANMVLLDTKNVGKPRVLLPSGFDQNSPRWAAGGKMIYYLTNELGMRNMTSGGQEDVYAVFPDVSLYESFQSDPDEQKTDALVRHRDTAVISSKPVPPDFSGLRDRVMRLTTASAGIADAVMSASGEKLYYLGRSDNSLQLWVSDLRKHDTKVLAGLAEGDHLDISADGKTIYVSGNKLFSVNTADGRVSAIAPQTRMIAKVAAERAYILDHVYRAERQKFWDHKLNGTDWDYYYENYKQFLPYVSNNYDMEILLSEFLGELNSSHTGAGYRPKPVNADRTAVLGLLYDPFYTGKGLKVAAVIKDGPFDHRATQLSKGSIIERIEGTVISDQTDVDLLFNQRSDAYTTIDFRTPGNHKLIRETIRPISLEAENQLLYDRWVRRMETLTDSLSKGRLGYFHIRAMDEAGLRKAYDGFNNAGRRKEAIVIDTRFNTGGNISVELVKMLQEHTTITGRPQGLVQHRSTLADGSVKPSILLISEGNYSDAFNFAYLYKRLAIGKIVGTPVAGTGTGVLWEPQIDRTLTVGIPQWGLSWIGEKELLENHTLTPDITIYNTYPKMAAGEDQQLETAIKELLKSLDGSNR